MKKLTNAEQRIISAFIHQLNEVGYKKITVTSLTKEAKVNRTTFYLYYDSIEGLAHYLCEDYFVYHFENYQTIDIKEEAHIKNVYESYRFIAQYKDAILALLSIKEKDFSPYLIMQNGYYQHMKKFLLSTQKEGKPSTEKIELFSRLHAGCCVTTMQYFLEENCMNIDEIDNSVMTSLHHGMIKLLD